MIVQTQSSNTQFPQRTKPPNPADSLFLSIRQLLHPLEHEGFVCLQTIGVVTAPEYADSLIAQPTRPKKPVIRGLLQQFFLSQEVAA
jgi:hypothetical protein